MNTRKKQIFRIVISGMILLFIIIGCGGNPVVPDPPQLVSVSPNGGVENSQARHRVGTD